MKTIIAAISAGILGLMTMTSAQADTVVSVTQVSYDYRNNPICTAVRMNPSTFAALPADPCTPSTAVGTSGPDRITQNVYDNASQLLATYEGVGTSDIRQYAYYNYTPNGQKAFEIDANHNKTTFTYDGFDRLSKVQYPNTTAGNEISSTTDYETFGYDANSNRTSHRRRNAQTVLYAYDNLNREIFKDLPAYAGSTTTSKDIYTGYDGLGHIVYKRFASASGSGVSYAYDGLGRVSSTTDINGRTLLFNYLANSQRNSMTFPDAQGQYYYYLNTGALNWTGIAGGGVAYVPTHDGLGRVVAVGRPNSTGTSYSYDGLSRLASMTNNFAGTANDITWSFNAYNAASQITNWNASTAVYDYVETATATDNRTYDGLNRDASIAAVTGGYDTAGNMANDGVRTFTYDVENRLITGSSALTALALNYDPEGRLYSYSYNGSTTSFLYDGTNLIGEYDGTGAMTRRYMHTLGTDQPWVQFTGSTVTAANATYLYSNYQGSIIATADMSGNVTDLFKYGPYGEPRNSANAESWTGNRFRYTGQTVIPEAKLYYYKARVYDPIAGRFLQTDPVGSLDDLDLYQYVGGDPINGTDPTGMIEPDCGALFNNCIVNNSGPSDKAKRAQAFFQAPPIVAPAPITAPPITGPTSGGPPVSGNPWVVIATAIIYTLSPSSTAPKEMDERAQWLYHYTNEKGMTGILSTMAILPSLKSINPQRARFGSGQYFTDIAPGTLSQSDLSRRLQTNPNGDYTHWVRVNVNGLGVVPVAGRPGSYLVPSHWPLQIGTRFGGAGAN